MARSGTLELDNATIYYEAEGAGHPLLLIHGGLGSLRMWDGNVPAFAQRYLVIRYDTRGFGRTETEDVEFTNGDDAVAVLDHLGAGSAYVIGQSRGGGIALDVAIDHPDRVDALISVAGGISGFEWEPPAGTEPPPWDEMERLWNEKEWERLAELGARGGGGGRGAPGTRVDAPAEVDAGHHLARSVTGARLVEFPGVAHMIQLEEPGGFNRTVLEFLDEV